MRLFHFSDSPDIAVFTPRPVLIPSIRPEGRGWLNGPLVWAIDEIHQPMYLFPRECPRILIWPTAETTRVDRDAWWGESARRMIAYAERAWVERIGSATLYRYDLPALPFENLEDAGMWVSREAVAPTGMTRIDNLPSALAAMNVELRLVASLVPLRDLWRSSLHVSGIRLRNAEGWERE